MVVKHLKNQYGSLINSKTMRSLSILLSANIINGIIGFVTSVLVLRYVENNIIAIIYPLISILMIVSQFGDLGLSNSFIKIASFHYTSDKLKSLQFFNAAFKLKLFLCILILLIGLPISPLIAKWTFGQPLHIGWIRWIIVVTCLQIMSSYATSALQVQGNFFLLSVVKIMPSLLKMILIAFVIWLGATSLSWIFWAFALVPIITFILAFMYTDRSPLYKINSNSDQLSQLFHVSKWVALSALANAIIGQVDVLMTSSIAGSDELNRLLGGQKLAGVFSVLTASLVTVLLPKVSSMKSKKELNFFLRKSSRIIFPIAFLLMAFLPFTKYLIPFILGSKYNSSVEVYNILMIGNIVSMVVTPLGLILYNLNKEPMFAVMNIIQLFFNIVGNYFFIRTHGAIGAAWITTLARLIAVIMIYYELHKEGILNYLEDKS